MSNPNKIQENKKLLILQTTRTSPWKSRQGGHQHGKQKLRKNHCLQPRLGDIPFPLDHQLGYPEISAVAGPEGNHQGQRHRGHYQVECWLYSLGRPLLAIHDYLYPTWTKTSLAKTKVI